MARAAMGLASLTAALVLLVAGAPVARALPRPPGGNFANPVVRAVDIAAPAVVRVATIEDATISVQLCTRAVTLPLSGPPYEIGVTGSGAFISSDGDILTADHVVDVPDDAIVEFAAQDIAALLNNASTVDPGCRTSAPVTAGDVASGLVNFGFTTHRSNVHNFAWLSTSYTGPLSITALRDVPTFDATTVVTSNFNQDDLAVIHVNMNDTPSVRLDDSSAVAVEDHLTVIGFPGNGDVNDNPTNFLTPSVNDVQVSAIKTGDNGTQLIQVGGNVEHGDSGGPVLDDAGHIVGVVSFGGPDPRGLTTFLRTSNAALSLIQSQGVSLAPGPFQQAWARAFGDYTATYAGHWHTAAREMTQLASSYPQFQALTPYLNYAQNAAAQEQLPQKSNHLEILAGLPQWVLIAAGVIVLLVAVGAGLGVWALMRHARRRKAPAAAPVPAYAYAGNASYPGVYPSAYPGSYRGYAAPLPYSLPAGSYPAAPDPGPSPSAPGRSDLPGGYPTGPYAPTGPITPIAKRDDANGASWSGTVAYGTPGASDAFPRTPLPLPSRQDAPEGNVAPFAGQPAPAMVVCVNGHWFAAHEPRCPWCGAPQTSLAPAGTGPSIRPWEG